MLLGAGVYGVAAVQAHDDNIFPNVYVAGVNVGGMSKDDAIAAVNQALQDSYGTTPLTVQLPDRTIRFDPKLVNVSIDVETAVDAAWDYGRTGNVFSRAKLHREAKNPDNEKHINAHDSLTLDEDYLKQVIAEAAADALVAREDSTSVVDAEEGTVTVKVGVTGVSLDADALLEAVEAAYLGNDLSAPLLFGYTTEPFTPTDLDAIYAQLCTTMKDASYD
ncbi:MAG: peptidoglycan binding domain-containing protein, partial [Oscillospiraceae bacterium]|nr:peptidoglycan binding domain-containing protein [Oscillospiraceae bacterium]